MSQKDLERLTGMYTSTDFHFDFLVHQLTHVVRVLSSANIVKYFETVIANIHRNKEESSSFLALRHQIYFVKQFAKLFFQKYRSEKFQDFLKVILLVGLHNEHKFSTKAIVQLYNLRVVLYDKHGCASWLGKAQIRLITNELQYHQVELINDL